MANNATQNNPSSNPSPNVMSSSLPTLTQTKIRIKTKTVVLVLAGIAALGTLAWAGAVVRQQTRLVCDSGPNRGQTCSNKNQEGCRTEEAPAARCVKFIALPDLVVQSVIFDPRYRLPTISILNQGLRGGILAQWGTPPENTLQVSVQWLPHPADTRFAPGSVIGGATTGSSIATLGPGASTEVAFTYPAYSTPPDAGRARICVDIGTPGVLERNETNNCWEGDLPLPPRPDLHNLFERIPDTPTEGASFTLRVRVQNLGAAEAGPSLSNLRLDLGNDGTIDETLPTRSIPAIAAGATSEAVEWSWSAWPSGGPHRLVMCADSEESVTESDEGNNCSTAVIVANPAPVAGRLIFALHPASPSGASVPGFNEVFRFNMTAESESISVIGLGMHLNTTDNSNTDWNTWQASSEILGWNSSDFRLYRTTDLSAPLAVTWRFWGRDPVTDAPIELTGDEHAEIIVGAVTVNFDEPLTVSAGTTIGLTLSVDTSGASPSRDDTFQAVIDDVLATPRNPEGLPLVGGELRF
ncbi:hypothetical protein HY477_00795 [Candidatus Uhrbacteria bacterium]|nr:hypothetical protein [Candidatus Uhrbacteria bacterium]